MKRQFIPLAMMFCHIVDDYYLQGILASMKQKKWWEQNAPQEMYKNDYKVALIVHSFSWAFMVMLPIAIYVQFAIGPAFVIVLYANALIHGIVDHLKANEFKINLVTDQLVHLAQIVITFIAMLIII